MAITRTADTDDDGSGTTGTIHNNSWKTTLYDAMDSAYIQTKEVTFTETTGAGTYTGSVTVPAGATILDILITFVAVWTATTSATMKVGDTDDDGFFTGLNLKTAGPNVSASFSFTHSAAGVYIEATRVFNRYSASAHTISGIVTTVGAAGNAGRTRMTVVWSVPASGDITAASKV